MAAPESIWNVESLKSLMDERDLRYKAERDADRVALKIASDNNMHWKKLAEDTQKDMLDRERNFLSKGMGFIFMAISVISIVIGLFRMVT